MRYTVAYSFPFRFQGMAGHVEVYPAGAFVTYGGVGAQIEAWQGPILRAIFDARLAYANINRDHSPACRCHRCQDARMTRRKDEVAAFVREYNAGEWEAEG